MIATTSNKKAINVEIQLSNQKNIIKRTLYNWSRLYNKQIEEMYQNNEYSSPNKTIYINILNCNCLDTNKFHSTYRLGQVETNEELTDLEEIHFIEIPKLRELNLNDEADMLEVWIEFLRDPESEVIRNIEMSNEAVRKAKDKLYKLSQSKEDRELYFLREKSIRDEISALSKAKEEGIEQGMQKGAKEEKILIAKNLLDILDNNTISEKTGLSLEEVRQLRNNEI